MAAWIRNLIMLTVLAVWVPYMVISYVRHDQISELIWGVPGALYVMLNPTWRRQEKDGTDQK